jgi:acyl carrier protein
MSDVFDEVAAMVRAVIGDDFLLDTEIAPDTSLSQDLAMESIEFVELSEKLQERYGPAANLTAFIAGLDLDGIMGITVGQLAGYIQGQLAGTV